MDRKHRLGRALRRTLTSLAAIAAISTIFGAKALESAQRHSPAQASLAAYAGDDTRPGD